MTLGSNGSSLSELIAVPTGMEAISPDTISQDLFVNGRGTERDPHVYLGLVRDHRGLRPGTPDYQSFYQTLAELENLKAAAYAAAHPTPGVDIQEEYGVTMGEILTFNEDDIYYLTHASLPYETFTNLADGKKWGKYYSVEDDFRVIKPVPPGRRERIKKFVKDIGKAIVWFATEVILGLVAKLCEEFTNVTDSKAARAGATAIIGAATGGTTAAAVEGAIETARKICKGVIIVNGLWEATKDPSGEDLPVDEDRPSERVIARRGKLTPEPTYPAGAIAIFDSSMSKFRILVPGSAA